MTKQIIVLADRYDSDRRARVCANVNDNGVVWISQRQFKSAERRSGMMLGSVLHCLSDISVDEIYVCNDDNCVVDLLRVVHHA